MFHLLNAVCQKIRNVYILLSPLLTGSYRIWLNLISVNNTFLRKKYIFGIKKKKKKEMRDLEMC